MILIAQIDPDLESRAWGWHHAFARNSHAVFPRTADQFADFVAEGMAWGAMAGARGFVGLAYASLSTSMWEVGGLAVEEDARRKGIGLLLSCLTLGNLLFEEDPLADEPPGPLTVITHVLRDNHRPITIVEKILRFRLLNEVAIPGGELPGLKAEPDGFVHGYEYEIGVPETLEKLANWAEDWRPQPDPDLGDPIEIRLREGTTLSHWAEAFRRMAARERPASV